MSKSSIGQAPAVEQGAENRNDRDQTRETIWHTVKLVSCGGLTVEEATGLLESLVNHCAAQAADRALAGWVMIEQEREREEQSE